MSYADGLLSTGEMVEHREKQHWWVFVWGAKFTILALILALVVAILSLNMSPDGASGTLKTVLGWVAAGLFIFAIAILVWTALQYLSQEYVLTNRRVIEVSGVVNKRAVDSSLEKINDAVLTQSIFGRALGFGDLQVLTASESGISDFHMLRRPIEFKKAMLDAKHAYEMEVAGSGRPDAPPMRASAAPAAVAADPAPVAPTRSPAATPLTAATVATGGSASAPDPDATTSTPTPVGSSSERLDPDEVTRTLGSLADLRDRGAITADEYERKKTDLLGRL